MGDTMTIDSMTDAEIAAQIRRVVGLIKGNVLRHSERIKVDGLWVVVRVVEADHQRDPEPAEQGQATP
jgi:hypothetical protein